MARLDQLEEEVHGRQRNLQDEMELYFGVMVEDMGTKWDMDGYGGVHSHGGYPKNAWFIEFILFVMENIGNFESGICTVH